MNERSLDFETRAAQAGARVRVGDTLSTVGPITASSTFSYESVEEVHLALSQQGGGFAYSRNANPTVSALEEVLSSLEGAGDTVAFGSGMAAIHGALMACALEPGDAIVVATDLYGVTRSLLGQLMQYGIQHRFVDILDLDGVHQALRESNARVLCFESISNPLLRVPDVRRLVEIAHAERALALVDNTFATPYLFRPLEVGVDIVVHSATKYLAGHGDVVAGYGAANRSFAQRMRDARTVAGGVLSPFEAWLTVRGIKTLPLRMERQCASAQAIASWLERQTWVRRVYYPGLAGHAQRGMAAQLFDGRFGGMVSFDLDAGEETTVRFINSLQLITAATSLGDAMSLVLYPTLSSHRTLTPQQRREAGIGDSLVRVSVGLESPEDLIRDLEAAAAVAEVRSARTTTASP